MLSELKVGIYRHYKGPLYQLFGIGHDANADQLFVEHDEQGYEHKRLEERIVVVYQGLQLDGAHLGPRITVRTLDMAELDSWTDWVHRDGKKCQHLVIQNRTGAWCHCEIYPHQNIKPRFQYLGVGLTEEMLSDRPE